MLLTRCPLFPWHMRAAEARRPHIIYMFYPFLPFPSLGCDHAGQVCDTLTRVSLPPLRLPCQRLLLLLLPPPPPSPVQGEPHAASLPADACFSSRCDAVRKCNKKGSRSRKAVTPGTCFCGVLDAHFQHVARAG